MLLLFAVGAPARRTDHEANRLRFACDLHERMLGQWRQYPSRGQRRSDPAQRRGSPVPRRDTPALRHSQLTCPWFAAAHPRPWRPAAKIALAFTVFLTTPKEPPTARSMEALCV